MTGFTTKGRVGCKLVNFDEWFVEANNNERFPPETTFVLLERTEYIEFITKAKAMSDGLFFQHWRSGRLFNSSYELQWERRNETFSLRLLTEGDWPEGWKGTEFDTGEEISLLLFGERKRDSDPGWREARIPRWLKYPVDRTSKRVRLVAIPYLREGMIVRMRWKGVKTDG